MTVRPQIAAFVGLDGAGKSTAILRLSELYAARMDQPIFNVPTFEKIHDRLPTLHEVGGSGVLMVAEPTYSRPTGTDIRHDLLRDGIPMTVPEEARRYANDRERLYRNLVIPFLNRGHGWVVQSRSLACSLTYQAQRWPEARDLDHGIRMVLSFPGNQLELEYAPKHLFIFDLNPLEALARMKNRELDHFERNVPLQARVRDLYLHPSIQAPFRERGTIIHVIDASRSKEETSSLIENIFHQHS